MHKTNFTWTARVRWAGNDVTAYTRNNAFTVSAQASFRETDKHPNAVEYLLGALGGDLISGFASQAARDGVQVYGLEASVLGQLNNPLVLLGVVGESGHPGFETLSCTLYVSADASEPVLQEIWQTVLVRSPIVNTLNRCLNLALDLRMIESI